MPSAEFSKAAEDSRKLTSKPDNTELLELYALFKIANAEDFEKAEKPGMFDLKAKAKYGAWKKEVEAGTDAATAETRYIALVETLKGKYGFDPDKKPE